MGVRSATEPVIHAILEHPTREGAHPTYYWQTRDVNLHLHGVVVDRNNHSFAGHFMEGENLTLANVEIAIAEMTGMNMSREVEPELGWELLTPTDKPRLKKMAKSNPRAPWIEDLVILNVPGLRIRTANFDVDR